MTAEVCEAAIAASFFARFSDPEETLRFAQLAADLADSRPDLPALIRSKAFANLGNALRIRDDLGSAEIALLHAVELLPPNAPTVEQAQVYSLLGSLRECQRQLPAALDVLAVADGLFEEAGHLRGRCRIAVQRSLVLGHLQDPGQAVRCLIDGAVYLRAAVAREKATSGGRVSPETANIGRALVHNLVSRLCEDGDPRSAYATLTKAEDLLAGGDVLQTLKVNWLRGRVAAGLGERGAARARYRSVLLQYTRRRMAQEGALVALELASMEADEQAWGEVQALVREVEPLLLALGLGPESTAAGLLRRAATERAAGLLARVARICALPGPLRRTA